jgi:hypothetical protein
MQRERCADGRNRQLPPGMWDPAEHWTAVDRVGHEAEVYFK